jgi:MscS family membrane protein
MKPSEKKLDRLWWACSLGLCLLLCSASWSQAPPTGAAPAESKTETPQDTLGRNTPRGTVLGFISASRKGNAEISVLYLNTSLRGAPAQNLARQLATVLDRRLPARLNQLSDKPEGALPDLLKPNEDLVGTISTTEEGDLDISLERVDRGKGGRVWLFSNKTLASIPEAFEELTAPAVDKVLPPWLVNTRLATIPLFEWLAVFVGMPLLYFLTGLLNRGASLGIGAAWRRWSRDVRPQNPRILPPPIRLLVLAAIIRWLLGTVGLPLLARQFWLAAVTLICLVACIWLLLLLNGWLERFLLQRLRRRNLSGATSMLRLSRRMGDLLILFGGLLFTLRYFGVNLTAALAGLGVGGVAVALAAQKTLENVIGGISLILDQALRVGDTLKLGNVLGTVESVGLRSTTIRTLDRTLVSVPNGQIATMSIETLSARDKFWFHHLLTLLPGTTPAQMRLVVASIRSLLAQHSLIEGNSARVSFLRFGTFSVDVEIFAYVIARDWNHFLEIQEDLLLRVTNVIREAGTEIALPSQTMYSSAERSLSENAVPKVARAKLA